ncbi:MAG TPA: bifunctional 4-hydroxy-2-oxoglutarate aldolase/2-dehydro-3-deoxy-phosphogluconate aldolase [Candidatus Saccharimonadales bacterium]|nr:bifunctional 4-hydroxy-2-oxoglutarate aldolase/2-dehydro-3-deoxy-phosphogluconate aldolase [Candidatus Saccharimonadales bacterium]
MIDAAIQKIQEVGIIPVVRAANVDEARRAVDAICAGGIPIIEITMTVPGAPDVIRQLVRDFGTTVLTGAGTVTTAQQAEMCMDAGAQFLVSPGLSVPVVQAATRRSILALPGALTPTEVMAALDAGARVIKIFPCSSAGGPKHIKALKAPFPDGRFVPTGGVNLATAPEYLAAGAFALGVGADLVDLQALRRNEASKIVEMAKALVAVVAQARPPRT